MIISRIAGLAVALATFLACTLASAAPIYVTGKVSTTGTQWFTPPETFKAGTVLDLKLAFEIDGNFGFNHPTFSNVSGALTWNDGQARSYAFTSIAGTSLGSDGTMGLAFRNPSTTYGDFTLNGLYVKLHADVNPFYDVGSYAVSYASSTFSGIQINGKKGESWVYGDIANSTGFTGTVGTVAPLAEADVPEPASLGLMGIALMGLVAGRRRRA